jgi:hypothetical protein
MENSVCQLILQTSVPLNKPCYKQTGYGIGSAAEPKASDRSLSSPPQSSGEATPTKLNL